MLVDTDVLIRHLRGYPEAAHRLDCLDTLEISVVTHLELLQGMRNKAEIDALKKTFERRRAVVHPLTEAVSERAIFLMETLVLSHGLQMGDALIAATALQTQSTLLTGNVRHFAPIAGLAVEAFRP